MGATGHDVQLEAVLERVAKWEEDGTLERVDRVLHFLNAAVDSITPEIVEGMVETIAALAELADELMHSKVAGMVPEMMNAADTALQNSSEQKRGLTKMLRHLREPEVQDGVRVLLEMVRVVGSGVKTGVQE